jgi:undecaprenyl-diphosphatase
MTTIILETLKAIFLGIIEGFTEFLPISSTGHLILVNQFVAFDKNFTLLFDIVIQLGAILAVVVLFWKKLLSLEIWKKTIVGILPAVLFGALFASKIEEKLFNPWTVALALIIGGLIILYIDRKTPSTSSGQAKINSISQISFKTAFLIGIIQCLSFIPGTSRSAATIIGAMALGATRFVATEFSFFLAIPTMVAASTWSLLKYGKLLDANNLFVLIIGFIVSFVVALISIKFLMDYIKKHNFNAFGYYRIVLGIIIVLYFVL